MSHNWNHTPDCLKYQMKKRQRVVVQHLQQNLLCALCPQVMTHLQPGRTIGGGSHALLSSTAMQGALHTSSACS